jgi:uncharacterized protein with GYD domain
MASYIALINWTDKGIAAYGETTKRAEAAKGLAAKYGGSLTKIWWTVGPYDLVAHVEFPDDESMTAYLLALGAMGNLRTTTMRAFDAAEMDRIIARNA